MKNDKPAPLERELLSKIMAAYADIWADVILGKNLTAHLILIREDILMLNELIDGKEALQENTLRYYRLVNMLYRMKDVIQDKIEKANQVDEK
jgi:hypothetical protein